MRVWIRSVAVVAAGTVLVGAAGCSALGGGVDGPPTPPKDELASLDPCSILNQQEKSQLGLQGPGDRVQDVSWSPGCMYDSDDLGITVSKDTQFSVDAIHGQSQWAKWEQTDINGRPAVTAINAGSTKARLCSTMFDAGKGRIEVQVGTNHPGDNSFCEKSQEVAKQIEPRMPKKQ